MLKPEAVHTVGLAFHELATNATKYGAFSTRDGLIDVSWSIESAGVGGKCVITWRERGGPSPKAPTRKGFGRYVTERMVGQSLNAIVQFDFAPDGLVWTVEVPLDQFLLEPERVTIASAS
jgi:two-component system CheB/CheR fusion protein